MKKLILILSLLLFPLSTNAMTLNIVSDIHAGSSKECGSYKCVLKWKQSFQQFLDETEGTIITVGDNTDQGKKTYVNQLKEMTRGEDIYWANGNHDGKVYVGGAKHYVINKDDWHIVIAHYKDTETKGGRKWIADQLKGYENKKVIVFAHYPVYKVKTTNINKSSRDLVKIYAKYKVDYVFSGHWHGDNWTREKDGVTYRAIRGLTTGFTVNYQIINFN